MLCPSRMWPISSVLISCNFYKFDKLKNRKTPSKEKYFNLETRQVV